MASQLQPRRRRASKAAAGQAARLPLRFCDSQPASVLFHKLTIPVPVPVPPHAL